jgi:hypothetical protein
MPEPREPMVGSLIYGDHKLPKKARPWKERWKIPTAVGVVFIAIIVLVYEFGNYRQEGAVKQFLNEVLSGHAEAAYARWDLEGSSYTLKDFLSDWGPDGYYTKDVKSAKVMDSNSKGQFVVVYAEGLRNTDDFPLALRVDNETLKLSFWINNKYKARAQKTK